MKKVWYWIFTLVLTGVIQSVLALSFYPGLFDEVLGKGFLEGYAVFGTVVLAFLAQIILNLIHTIGADEDDIGGSHFVSPLGVGIVVLIISLIFFVVIDFVFYLMENMFGLVMGILISCAMIGHLLGAFKNPFKD